MRARIRAIYAVVGENGIVLLLFGFYIGVSVLACLNTACRIAFLAAPCVIGGGMVLGRRVLQARERYFALIVCAACVLSGLFSLGYHDLYRASYTKSVGETYTGDGVVLDIYAENVYGGSYLVRFSDDVHRLPYTMLLTTENACGWQYGERIRGSVTVEEWTENDGFSTERYYGAKGAVVSCTTADALSVGSRAVTLRLWLRQWRSHLASLLSAHVRDEGLCAAVFLGDRSGLSASTKLWFRRLGIYHLLAVSGTHLGILINGTERVLKGKKYTPKARSLGGMAVCLFYMALTGFAASVLRAGCMYILAQVFRLRDAKIRGVYALALSATGIVLVSPGAVWDIGLQLSVCAVVGCYLFIALFARHRRLRLWIAGRPAETKRGKRLRRLRQNVLSTMAMTVLVTVVMLPLSCLYFGEISLVGFLANLFYIPAITGQICMTIAYLVLYPLRLAITPLAAVIEGYTRLILAPAKAIAGVRGICVSLAYPGMWLWLPVLFALTCLLPYVPGKSVRKSGRRFYALYAGALCLFAAYIAVCRIVTASQNVLVYENAGVREGFVVQSAGRVTVVDVSDGTYTFTKRLIRGARSRYAVEIEGYCLTHYHKRHVASFTRLVGDNVVYGLYLPQPQTEEEWTVYRSLTDVAAQYGIPVTTFAREITFGEIQLTLAARTYLSRSTHPITAARFAADETVVAYGSSSWNQGDEIAAQWFDTADVLIFGAHSPVYKKPFALAREDEPYAVVWNGKSAEYGEAIPAEHIVYDTREYVVRMR